MSLGHGAKIVTDKLLFAYDMGSRQSFKGAPTTNLWQKNSGLSDLNDYNGWGMPGVPGGSTAITTEYGTWKGSSIWRVNSTAGTLQGYASWRQCLPASSSSYPTTRRFQVKVKMIRGSISNLGIHNGGGTGGATYTPIDPEEIPSSIIDKTGWYELNTQVNWSNTSTGQCIGIGILASDIEFLVAEPAILSDVTAPTPYTSSTRSNTEALIDWTGKNTITANSLSYASDNTFSFNGSSNYIQAPSPLPDRYNWTIEFVAKQNAFVGGQVVLCPSSAGIDQSIRFNSSGQLYANFTRIADNNGFSVTASGASSVGEWAHYVVQRTPSNVKIYRNGVLEADSTQTGISAEWSGTWRIGQRGNSTGWLNGQVAIMRAYDKMLSANEVKINFNAIRGRFGI